MFCHYCQRQESCLVYQMAIRDEQLHAVLQQLKQCEMHRRLES